MGDFGKTLGMLEKLFGEAQDRIKELEKVMGDATGTVTQATACIEELKNQKAELVKALEFYAEKWSYAYEQGREARDTDVNMDGGRKARDALAKIGATKDEG